MLKNQFEGAKATVEKVKWDKKITYVVQQGNSVRIVNIAANYSVIVNADFTDTTLNSLCSPQEVLDLVNKNKEFEIIQEWK